MPSLQNDVFSHPAKPKDDTSVVPSHPSSDIKGASMKGKLVQGPSADELNEETNEREIALQNALRQYQETDLEVQMSNLVIDSYRCVSLFLFPFVPSLHLPLPQPPPCPSPSRSVGL